MAQRTRKCRSYWKTAYTLKRLTPLNNETLSCQGFKTHGIFITIEIHGGSWGTSTDVTHNQQIYGPLQRVTAYGDSLKNQFPRCNKQLKSLICWVITSTMISVYCASTLSTFQFQTLSREVCILNRRSLWRNISYNESVIAATIAQKRLTIGGKRQEQSYSVREWFYGSEQHFCTSIHHLTWSHGHIRRSH